LEFWTQKPSDEQNFMNLMLSVGNAQLEPVRSLIQPYSAGDEIVPGITAVAAPGHTLGHHAFLISGGDDKLLHLMDAAVHYLVGPEEPDWALGVEMDQTAAADTRRKLFKLAADENLLVAGYHFPFPGLGKIIPQDNAWRYVPVQTA
jgi:glyoxylase-like metal-dependent hydrolase (beta-lactamase superfamily II)